MIQESRVVGHVKSKFDEALFEMAVKTKGATRPSSYVLKVALIHITSLFQGCHVVVLLSHVRRRKGWK